MQVAQAVEPFDGQSQEGQEPTDLHAVGMMMADVFDAVMAFSPRHPFHFQVRFSPHVCNRRLSFSRWRRFLPISEV